MVKFKKYKIVLFTTLISLLSINCAYQLPPGGGDVDKTAPEVVETFPANNTLNFKENYVEFTFSEYVDKRSVKDAVFISPKPKTTPEFSWTNKTLRVTFLDTLKKGVTYTITIGTTATDYNNHNPLKQAYNLSFSTGNKIDLGGFYGKVFDKESQGVYILAYKYVTDSTTYLSSEPEYISQCGLDGNYSFSGIAPSKYRLFALKSASQETKYNISSDKIGIPSHDIILTEKDSIIHAVNFTLTEVDTIAPQLQTAMMTDSRHIVLSFTHEPLVDSIRKNNVFLEDTLNMARIEIYDVYKGRAKEKEIVLLLADTLLSKKDYRVCVTGITDKYGNVAGLQKIDITRNGKPDTTAIEILGVEPKLKNIENNSPTFKVLFDDIFVPKAKDFVKIFDTVNTAINYSLIKTDRGIAEFKITSKLKSNNKYKISLDLSKLPDLAGNVRDSIHSVTFTTFNELEYTALSGTISGLEPGRKLIIVLESIDAEKENKIVYKTSPKDSKFSFKKVIPGKYKMYAYYSLDGSNYFGGRLFPFKFSEKIFVHPKEIELPARWEVLDFLLNLN